VVAVNASIAFAIFQSVSPNFYQMQRNHRHFMPEIAIAIVQSVTEHQVVKYGPKIGCRGDAPCAIAKRMNA